MVKKKIQKSVCQVGIFSASSTVHLQEESGFFSTVLVRYLEIAIRSTLTLLFLRLNHVSQPLFIHHVFHCLRGDSLLDCSHIESFSCNEETKTEYSRSRRALYVTVLIKFIYSGFFHYLRQLKVKILF